MEASQHSLLAACFALHSINATLATVPQRGAGLWITRTSVMAKNGIKPTRRNVNVFTLGPYLKHVEKQYELISFGDKHLSSVS
jgi:hypothetical protein